MDGSGGWVRGVGQGSGPGPSLEVEVEVGVEIVRVGRIWHHRVEPVAWKAVVAMTAAEEGVPLMSVIVAGRKEGVGSGSDRVVGLMKVSEEVKVVVFLDPGPMNYKKDDIFSDVSEKRLRRIEGARTISPMRTTFSPLTR